MGQILEIAIASSELVKESNNCKEYTERCYEVLCFKAIVDLDD